MADGEGGILESTKGWEEVSPFADRLPCEVREMIYCYLIQEDFVVDVDEHGRPIVRFESALFSINKKVRAEAWHCFMRVNSFVSLTVDDLSVLVRLGPVPTVLRLPAGDMTLPLKIEVYKVDENNEPTENDEYTVFFALRHLETAMELLSYSLAALPTEDKRNILLTFDTRQIPFSKLAKTQKQLHKDIKALKTGLKERNTCIQKITARDFNHSDWVDGIFIHLVEGIPSTILETTVFFWHLERRVSQLLDQGLRQEAWFKAMEMLVLVDLRYRRRPDYPPRCTVIATALAEMLWCSGSHDFACRVTSYIVRCNESFHTRIPTAIAHHFKQQMAYLLHWLGLTAAQRRHYPIAERCFAISLLWMPHEEEIQWAARSVDVQINAAKCKCCEQLLTDLSVDVGKLSIQMVTGMEMISGEEAAGSDGEEANPGDEHESDEEDEEMRSTMVQVSSEEENADGNETDGSEAGEADLEDWKEDTGATIIEADAEDKDDEA